MDTQKVTTEYRLSKWAQIIQTRIDSGQNVEEFCQAAGITRNAYFYWQRKLREAACTELVKADNSKNIVPSGWMQLTSKQAQGANESLDIEINGYHIVVTNGTDTELLKKGLPDAEVAMMRFGEKPVYLCCRFTDMRKSINGLMTLVKDSFSLDPFADALFVFCNKSRDRIKLLEWDGDGFWLYFKRLERGHFHWPKEGDSPTMVLDSKELNCLIDGARLEKKLKREEVFERLIS